MDPSNDVELLSRSDLLAVYRCNGGCVHLRLGMLTLDLTAEQFWELVKCVGEASVRLTVRDVVEEFVNVHAPPALRTVRRL